ncbi:MAG: dicarboxylate/amino acid:cation symporter [Pirellulaceae bacterium]|nr:dicarboxylate/amino acid:cation symporter [Pirellulaceae bacterium]
MFRIPLHWQIFGGMVIGAAVGLALNAFSSQRESRVPGPLLPRGVREVVLRDSTNLIDIRVVNEDGSVRQMVVDESRREPGSFASLEGLQQADPQAYAWFHDHGRSWARWFGDGARRLGGLFLRLLRMVAVPLIVTSLITGVLGLGGAERLGKMFLFTLGYYVTTSLLAISTGLLMVNLIRPGLRGVDRAPAADGEFTVSGNLVDILFAQLEAMIPANPVAALADSSFLSIISFSLLFAIFTLLVGGRSLELLQQFFEAAFAVMMRMTLAIIKLCPAGVLFLMMYVTATQGWDVFKSLAWYMLAVLCALGFHAMVTLPAIVWFVGRRSPYEFARAVSPALLTAFSSASSNGTLPLTMANVEQRAGVSNRVSSFVLPLGATINMDGTALYEAVAVLFIGQLYHGFSLPLSQQIIVAFTALLASIGAAGIPHAGLVMMVIILQAVGLPVEMQGIILAVDRVLDMCRTSVNVWSDACGCAVIARLQPPGDEKTAA